MLSREDDDRCEALAVLVADWNVGRAIDQHAARDGLLFLLALARRLEAEIDRLRALLDFRDSQLHDKRQDDGGAACERCRLEGRKEGLLGAAALADQYGSGDQGASILAVEWDARHGPGNLADRLRDIAGQVDNSTGGGLR